MRFCVFVLLVIVACTIQSCKEGCKDKSAINYDNQAKVDNGTCLYCTGSSTSDSGTYFLIPQNAGNQNAPSIEFIVVSTNSGFSGNGCQTQGKSVGSECTNALRLVNLTGQTLEGFFTVVFTQNNEDIWFFQEQQNIVLGQHDTLNFGIVDSLGCSNITIGTLTLENNGSNLQFF
jgi:hypothetical protein